MAILLIYMTNLLDVYLPIAIPFNLITLLVVSVLGVSGLIGLIALKIFMI
jgi:hypothetical protein